MVLSNQSDDDNYFTDNFRVPTVMVDETEGNLIADYAKTAGATATIRDTGSIRNFTPAPSMALFSSRGPNPSAGSIIKPDSCSRRSQARPCRARSWRECSCSSTSSTRRGVPPWSSRPR